MVEDKYAALRLFIEDGPWLVGIEELSRLVKELLAERDALVQKCDGESWLEGWWKYCRDYCFIRSKTEALIVRAGVDGPTKALNDGDDWTFIYPVMTGGEIGSTEFVQFKIKLHWENGILTIIPEMPTLVGARYHE
jgi:hypothetical protein